MWGIIPIKNVNEAKHRLRSILSPKERRELFVVMFEDVLATMMKVPELDSVSVATICPTAAEIARRNGASIISTGLDKGQTAAVAMAANALHEDGIESMLMIPGDVPLVTVEEIQRVLEVHGKEPSITIVPSRDEKGSNCIVLSPTTALPLCFGANSYFPHLENARKHGLELNTTKLNGIGLDIDTPEDLLELCQLPERTQAQVYLRKQKILERLTQNA